MCGIFGYVGDQHIDLKGATDIIKHRGPDSDGFLQYNIDSGSLVYQDSQIDSSWKENFLLFGFRRLAIIDLNERANQPFSSADNKYHLVFNGEIYNYKELRSELEAIGYKFLTSSDTEVLLNAYVEWGIGAFKKLNGMWAVGILDIPNQKLICSRDRFGIKPFYYSFNTQKKSFCFGSEIKQLFKAGVKKEFNENILLDFLDKSIVDHSQETFYKNVFSLKPGSYMEMPLENITDKKSYTYWSLKDSPSYEVNNYEDATKQFKELFTDSVRLRFRSDVPVGSCLSGGLDSSSIVSTAADIFDFPIHTFTSRYDIKKYDESYYANLIHEKYKTTVPNYCQLDESLFLAEIDKVIYHQDEPFPSMSILAQWEVMKKAKEENVVVLLDGQGGDESLAGYRKFYAFYLKELLSQFKLGKFFKELIYLQRNKGFNFFDLKGIKRYLNISEQINYLSPKGKTLKSSANFGFSSAKTLQDRSRLDIEKFSFPPLLRYEDRNSMAFSIETRIPFMDYRLVEFLYSMPSEYKIRNGFTKAILRDAMVGILPEQIKDRVSKLGFATPQDIWMENGLRNHFISYFEKMRNPYLDHTTISSSFKSDSKKDKDLFFRIYCFDRWYQTNFNEAV
jgi:asparagine synthase (glutamine-hydrolysing)